MPTTTLRPQLPSRFTFACAADRSSHTIAGFPSEPAWGYYCGEALTSYLGELAALLTAVAWAVSSLFFTSASRRVGSLVVNRTRLAFAVLLVGAAHWLTYGQPFPSDAEGYRIFWLGLSAIVGLVIGDSLLFQSYVLVGTRIGVLLFSLGPIFGALLAWIFLRERLGLIELAAMALILVGVAWVVLERAGGGVQQPRTPDYFRGILYGVGAQLCQAAGLVMAKRGLDGGFPALSGVMIRMLAAAIVIWALAVVTGKAGDTIRRVAADRRSVAIMLGGSFAGPFFGVWMSLVAVQLARVGIASTLMAMTPVVSLPLVHWVYKERISCRALLGTLVAMVGVAALILL